MTQLIPLASFVFFYLNYDIIVATQSLALTTLVIYLAELYQGQQKKMTEHANTWFLILMCGLTLFKKDPVFLAWKATVMYCLIPIMVSGYRLYTKQSIIQKLVSNIPLHTHNYPWIKADITVSFLSSMLALTNITIYYQFGEDNWLKFKAFAFLFIFAMMVGLAYHLQQYIVEDNEHNPA
ncbi:septation protein IspZ [Candidatus Comchoanobacter bicostacola]|uniref:Septation protein IspZ n=1 Tax=Candidatus Comchoanobacter bicostacola TaxID=2919598 RepID=A0ABY5DKA3_9GAMM|nr:septation protein IspZ [Candidatus Comchoanobacter bicostacola]UTC24918.1 septation protein IspZ [Candidatus Comchoanobacter bicostacola]